MVDSSTSTSFAPSGSVRIYFGLTVVDFHNDRPLFITGLVNVATVRALRHDLRHQLAVLRSYSEQNTKLTDYIDTLITQIPSKQCTYCENTAVNAIIAYYAALAQKSGIELSIKLAVPGNTEQLTDSNLCVIFGNLFENAIEACNHMSEGHKFIHLSSRLQYETLTIIMDNSFNGVFTQKGKKFVSSKRNEIGTGLTSVTTMARKQGGGANFELDGFVFLSSVYIQIA